MFKNEIEKLDESVKIGFTGPNVEREIRAIKCKINEIIDVINLITAPTEANEGLISEDILENDDDLFEDGLDEEDIIEEEDDDEEDTNDRLTIKRRL